ncbi:hypothetical protein [Halonotius pteroides]|jgi:hypothetical protein|uniref:Uncharacterized protein n=1 Tax=Halonotius pteroides TaxID=268735 RepID=A0A3A6PXB6_9EURY|nr:hypothetical protein [Halonotius pteroides]RJX48415.1 hypothetical protein DP106_12295 [Halonotius pteroides]
MPTRRTALAALGVSVGLAGCLGGPPELDPQLPGFEEAENGTADGENDPFAGVVFREQTLQDKGAAVDFVVTAENTGTERQPITLRAFLYTDDTNEPLRTVDRVFDLRPGVEERVGFPNGGIKLSPSERDRLTRLIINAKVGGYGANFQELATFSGEDVRAVGSDAG